MAVRRMDCFAHKSCPDSCCWVTEGAQGITKYLGLARAIYIYIWCIYGTFGRQITKYTVHTYTVLAKESQNIGGVGRPERVVSSWPPAICLFCGKK